MEARWHNAGRPGATIAVRRCTGAGCLGLAVAVILLAARAPTLRAEDDSDPKVLLQKLNEEAIDPSQIYLIRNARFTRDRVNFYLNRGVIGFFAPVRSEITGAVFSGDGEVLVMPPDAVERRSLEHFTHSAILEEPFTSAYFRFTDETARELQSLAHRAEVEESLSMGSFASQWAPLVRRLNPQYSARVLMDLLGERTMPLLASYLTGTHLGSFQVEVDERLQEGIRVGAARQNQGRTFADVWCSFPTRRGETKFDALSLGPIRVKSYKVDTRIRTDNSLEARADLEIESQSDVERAFVFELSRLLRIHEVRDEAGDALTVFRGYGREEPGAETSSNDWIVVVLDRPIPAGRTFRLQFTYEGDVIADAGNGVLHIGERESWYPNRGLMHRAFYDLTFHFPDRLTLVATGDRVEEKSEGGWTHSHWVSRQPLSVSGFNLGAYDFREQNAGGLTIEAYATRQVESELTAKHLAMQVIPDLGRHRGPTMEVPIPMVGPAAAPPDPAALLDRVTDVAAETVVHFEGLFGPLTISRLAISQVPGHFGQGWPGLVYLPTLSFLSRAEREHLGVDTQSPDLDNELTLAHEIAHQWWGNHIGWRSYRDQWLSEGFATYAAALQLTAGKNGPRRFHDLLRTYKTALLSKAPSGSTIESGGPIVLGQRLSNSLNPEGYANIIYKKSCWVIHMLRCLMSDGAVGPEETFFKMLRDFSAAYAGQSPSTADFVRHAEKYMTPALDLDRNHRLDWFFDDWVYDTGIPSYSLAVNIRRTTARNFVVAGEIQQSDVPADFEMPVPLIAHYGHDRSARLGWVVVGKAGGRFRFTTSEKPTRVAIDEDSILAIAK